MGEHSHAVERSDPRACLLAAAAAWGFLPAAESASEGTPPQVSAPPAHVQAKEKQEVQLLQSTPLGSARGPGPPAQQLAATSEPQQHAAPRLLAASEASAQSPESVQQPEQSNQSAPMSTTNWWRLLPLQPGAYRRAIVFDTETSGFSNDDEILEIGAVELDLRTPSSAQAPARLHLSTPEPTGAIFHTLLASTRPVNPHAEKVHGIQQAELRAAPPRAVALRRFLRFVGEDAALVAHNAPFDMRFLRQDLLRCGCQEAAGRLEGRSFCTVAAFRHLRGPNSASDLESACYLLRVAEGAPGSVWRRGHSALVDALLGAKLFIEIAQQAGNSLTAIAAPGNTPRAALEVVSTRLEAMLPMPWRPGENREVLGNGGSVSEPLKTVVEVEGAPVKRRRLPGSFS